MKQQSDRGQHQVVDCRLGHGTSSRTNNAEWPSAYGDCARTWQLLSSTNSSASWLLLLRQRVSTRLIPGSSCFDTVLANVYTGPAAKGHPFRARLKLPLLESLGLKGASLLKLAAAAAVGDACLLPLRTGRRGGASAPSAAVVMTDCWLLEVLAMFCRRLAVLLPVR